MILNKDQLLLDAEYWFPYTELGDLEEIKDILMRQGVWNFAISHIYDDWANGKKENVNMLPVATISWLALLIREAME